VEPESAAQVLSLTPSVTEQPEELETLIEEPVELDAEALAALEPQPLTDAIAEEPEFALRDESQALASQIELSSFADVTAPQSDLLQEAGVTGESLSGRGSKARAALVERGGGNAQSEAAVERALEWLAAHQNSDGSWDLDHRHGPCNGRCGDPGSRMSSNGATALALLPFLGAGQTHKQGKHKKTVADGLQYLVRSIRKSRNQGGSLNDGGMMYAHGLATIALCEAYAMTKDRELKAPAQSALKFIEYAQDPSGGGWRYTPRQPGDTSVVGWQVMALKSGHMANLQVSPSTVKKASKFLDSVQVDDGAAYGYTHRSTRAGTSAVGLLSRMYLGWDQEHPALEEGVRRLAALGPSSQDLYNDYYATQVMFQYTGAEGATWAKWNKTMRDHLIATQEKNGHARGSWYLGGNHSAEAGGRLYCTAMAAMTLEVYYRHLPLYRADALANSFPN